jgi:hypothetical protein
VGKLERATRAIQPWQTIIGAIVGFSGVCLTIFFTWEASRLADFRRFKTEATSLRKGLYVELSLIDHSVTDTIEAIRLKPEEPFPIARIERNLLYRSNLDKLTLLTPDEVASVYEAYDAVSFIDANNRLLFPPVGAGVMLAQPSQATGLLHTMTSVHDVIGKARDLLRRNLVQ